LAGVGNNEIKGALSEEELMGSVIDFLTTEIPDVDAEGIATVMRKVKPKNINTFCGFFRVFSALKLELVFGVDKFVCKASFSRSTFTNNQKLSLINVICFFF
jgi:hypothetical protein